MGNAAWRKRGGLVNKPKNDQEALTEMCLAHIVSCKATVQAAVSRLAQTSRDVHAAINVAEHEGVDVALDTLKAALDSLCQRFDVLPVQPPAEGTGKLF